MGLSLLAEGASWRRARGQTRAEAEREGMGFAKYVRASRDPNVKMVLFEDSAALIGIVLAAVGIGCGRSPGSSSGIRSPRSRSACC